jgi:hypothetical protein
MSISVELVKLMVMNVVYGIPSCGVQMAARAIWATDTLLNEKGKM